MVGNILSCCRWGNRLRILYKLPKATKLLSIRVRTQPLQDDTEACVLHHIVQYKIANDPNTRYIHTLMSEWNANCIHCAVGSNMKAHSLPLSLQGVKNVDGGGYKTWTQIRIIKRKTIASAIYEIYCGNAQREAILLARGTRRVFVKQVIWIFGGQVSWKVRILH